VKATNVIIKTMSKSGKTCLIQFDPVTNDGEESRQIGHTFAWVKTLAKDEVGDDLPNFEYQCLTQATDDDGLPVFYKDTDGNPTAKPVLRVQF